MNNKKILTLSDDIIHKKQKMPEKKIDENMEIINEEEEKKQSEKERKHEEEILKKHKILNEDAQSIDSIKDSAQIIIHKKVDDRIDETKTTNAKNVMSFRSNNKIKV